MPRINGNFSRNDFCATRSLKFLCSIFTDDSSENRQRQANLEIMSAAQKWNDDSHLTSKEKKVEKKCQREGPGYLPKPKQSSWERSKLKITELNKI